MPCLWGQWTASLPHPGCSRLAWKEVPHFLSGGCITATLAEDSKICPRFWAPLQDSLSISPAWFLSSPSLGRHLCLGVQAQNPGRWTLEGEGRVASPFGSDRALLPAGQRERAVSFISSYILCIQFIWILWDNMKYFQINNVKGILLLVSEGATWMPWLGVRGTS